MPPLLRAYLALTAAADPLGRRLIERRRATGKEDADRWPERLGHARAARPEGLLVWLHAASVGESLSLLPLVEALLQRRTDIHVLVTSGTVTSAQLLSRRLPPRAVHQFVPLDLKGPITRFLNHWHPDLAVWTESEIWPRLVHETHACRIPMLLLNARLRARSLRRWTRASGTAAALFGCFEVVLAQDDATADGLRRLGAKEVTTAGSLKEAAAPLPADPAALRDLQDAVDGRFVWLAASTHRGEEALALKAHAAVRRVRPNALLLLVPRHPARGDEVAAAIERERLTAGRRTAGLPGPGEAVHLCDTLGEMGLWYRLAPISLVGGSFNGIGGHNPYEPIALGSVVLHGPDVANFADIYRDLDGAAAAVPIHSSDDLTREVLRLANDTERAAMRRRAEAIVAQGSEALETALRSVLDRLPDVQDGTSIKGPPELL
ncbi:3-deoxy-D-manno-octulosonic acid transferase [Roseitranquillus sediminis]|uniref:3-deoxy-D-manno-octulosonic acid transferase n=1 Tax=Roseitranquillus sediminis TaxID=2809051 RepID=UPI001D0C07CC|nr:3-deoxy-D-manno-octulosonic acid transferase [Roseitranquillus sediminis]